MTKILHIDTATPQCSVALSDGSRLLDLRETGEKNAHSRVVTIFMDELLKAAALEPADLDAVAVSKGPGSYTGLRIGVSTAKGLCYALEKPLIGIATLETMAAGMRQMAGSVAEDAWFCPMIDARRMEVYSALYDRQLKQVREIRAEVIDADSFGEALKQHRIFFGGDGAAKCKALLESNPNAVFLDDFVPSAAYMTGLALQKFRDQEFEDVAYFEPFYLKDFVAGVPRVKGLK